MEASLTLTLPPSIKGGVMEVIIMDFSFLESMVMAIVAIFTEVTAIPAIQG